MKSDHWNFLANLLGAPGAAEPPVEPAKKPEKSPIASTPPEGKTPPSDKRSEPKAKLESQAEPAVLRAEQDWGVRQESNAVQEFVASPKHSPTKSTSDNVLGFGSFRDLDDDEPTVPPAVAKTDERTEPPTRRATGESIPAGVPSDSQDFGWRQAAVSTETSIPAANAFSAADADITDDTVTGDEVLKALTAVTPPPQLPGFGVPKPADAATRGFKASEPSQKASEPVKSDRQENRVTPASDEPAKKESSMWGRIAGKFGVGSERRSERESEKRRPDEPVGPITQAKSTPDVDEDDLFAGFRRDPEPRAESPKTRESEPRQPSSRSRDQDRTREPERSVERTRRSIAKSNDDDDDLESAEVLPPDTSDDEGPRRSSRRRGRRGIRQRMSEEDADRLESPPRGEEEPDSTSPRRRGVRDVSTSQQPAQRESAPRRSEVTRTDEDEIRGASRDDKRESSRGRGRDRNRDRDRGPRGERTDVRPRRDAEADLDSDFEEVDDDDFGIGLMEDAVEPMLADDDTASAAPRSRSRRRGRRGRRRSGPETTDVSRRDVEDDVEEDELDNELEIVGFDDDHEDDEDDEEVEQIRSGSRRRPRSRRSGRSETPAADVNAAETTPRANRDTGTEGVPDAEAGRRRDIPTWLETVELLVNANIENHNRGGSKSQRGPRSGGGRRR